VPERVFRSSSNPNRSRVSASIGTLGMCGGGYGPAPIEPHPAVTRIGPSNLKALDGTPGESPGLGTDSSPMARAQDDRRGDEERRREAQEEPANVVAERLRPRKGRRKRPQPGVRPVSPPQPTMSGTRRSPPCRNLYPSLPSNPFRR
jgi:hypothetical protein